ncbi:MAG: hypothetical protein ABR536_07315 [Solirubrobacterales bacterium]
MPTAATAPLEKATRACAYLCEVSPEMRGCAILSPRGELLATSGESEGWEAPARKLIAAADAAGGEPVSQAHIGTVEGEVFMVRSDGMVAIAVAERFTLASLVLFDLRAVLHDLAKDRGPR